MGFNTYFSRCLKTQKKKFPQSEILAGSNKEYLFEMRKKQRSSVE